MDKKHREHESGKENWGGGNYKESKREKRKGNLLKHTFLENAVMLSHILHANYHFKMKFLHTI